MEIFPKVPIELFREIQQWLSRKEYFTFLISSNELFRTVKFETMQVTILKYAEGYFQTTLHVSSLVKYPLFQLNLVVDSVRKEIFNFQMRSLDIRYGGYDLDISNWRRKLNQIKHLSFDAYSSCFHDSSWIEDNSPNTVDFNGLPEVIHVRRYKGKATDFHSFSHLKELDVDSSDRITNVTPLAKLTKLILRDCPNIRDVSPLKNVYDLTLECRSGIEDVTSLTGNRWITISYCANIKNYYSFPNAVHVDLSLPRNGPLFDFAPDSTRFFDFSNARRLTIRGCINSSLRLPPQLFAVNFSNCSAI
jgi:hypothetical protein